MRYSFILSLIITVSFTACYKPMKKAEEGEFRKDTGLEYAPQMYHSIPYEPLTQITEEDESYWGTEYMNTNPITKAMKGYNTNVLMPVKGTVRYGQPLPYGLPNDTTGLRLANQLVNPFDLKLDEAGALTKSSNKTYLEGKELYLRFCSHCHGKTGESDGGVSEKYGGVTKYKSTLIGKNPGYVFHVLTYGKNRMPSHASQLNQDERWKIATFVIKEFKK